MTMDELTRSLEDISTQICIAAETAGTLCIAVSSGEIVINNADYVLQGIENTLKAVAEDMEEAISGSMKLSSAIERLTKGK